MSILIRSFFPNLMEMCIAILSLSCILSFMPRLKMYNHTNFQLLSVMLLPFAVLNFYE